MKHNSDSCVTPKLKPLIEMSSEISIASEFIAQYLPNHFTPEQIDSFRLSLEDLMLNKFQPSWDPEMPIRGSAFRAINVIDSKIDPILILAATEAGIELHCDFFPTSLVVFVDPLSVSYRIGDYGYPKVVFDGAKTVKTGILASPPNSPLSFKERVRQMVRAH